MYVFIYIYIYIYIYILTGDDFRKEKEGERIVPKSIDHFQVLGTLHSVFETMNAKWLVFNL